MAGDADGGKFYRTLSFEPCFCLVLCLVSWSCLLLRLSLCCVSCLGFVVLLVLCVVYFLDLVFRVGIVLVCGRS